MKNFKKDLPEEAFNYFSSDFIGSIGLFAAQSESLRNMPQVVTKYLPLRSGSLLVPILIPNSISVVNLLYLK
jgi:hypothetical protein